MAVDDDERWDGVSSEVLSFLVSHLQFSLAFSSLSVLWITELKEYFYVGTLDTSEKRWVNPYISDVVSKTLRKYTLIHDVLLMESDIITHIFDTMQLKSREMKIII